MSWIKAKLLLLSVALVWLFFIAVLSPLQLPVTLLAIPFKRLRNYRYKLWIAQDQLVNAIHNGNPDITVSSRIGWMAEQGSKTAAAMAVVVDWLFYIATGQVNHCRAAIERDEDHKL
jgi:uncharacterized membrane protein YhaH (DUF805 family)